MVALTSRSDLKAGYRSLLDVASTGYHRGHLWFCDFLRGLVFHKSSGFVGKAVFVKFGLVWVSSVQSPELDLHLNHHVLPIK